jgi:hypothetical protein
LRLHTAHATATGPATTGAAAASSSATGTTAAGSHAHTTHTGRRWRRRWWWWRRRRWWRRRWQPRWRWWWRQARWWRWRRYCRTIRRISGGPTGSDVAVTAGHRRFAVTAGFASGNSTIMTEFAGVKSIAVRERSRHIVPRCGRLAVAVFTKVRGVGMARRFATGNASIMAARALAIGHLAMIQRANKR